MPLTGFSLKKIHFSLKDRPEVAGRSGIIKIGKYYWRRPSPRTNEALLLQTGPRCEAVKGNNTSEANLRKENIRNITRCSP